MKKVLLATTLLIASSAFAASLQVEGGRTFQAGDKNIARVAVTEDVLGLTGQVGYDRTLDRGAHADAVSATLGKNLVTVGGVTVSAFGGAEFTNAGPAQGFGLVYGVGASYPLTKSTALVADFRQVHGQDRISYLDGNRVAAGVSMKF